MAMKFLMKPGLRKNHFQKKQKLIKTLKKNISWIKPHLFFRKDETEKTNYIFEKMSLVLSEKSRMKTSKSIQNSKLASFCLKHSAEKHITCSSLKIHSRINNTSTNTTSSTITNTTKTKLTGAL